MSRKGPIGVGPGSRHEFPEGAAVTSMVDHTDIWGTGWTGVRHGERAPTVSDATASACGFQCAGLNRACSAGGGNESIYMAILSIVLVSALRICDEQAIFIGTSGLGFRSFLRSNANSISIS